jgi:tetratricopeptide (TPR) repeat protein
VNYRAALQLDPTFVTALFNLAILRTGPSPFEAEELYRQVIGLEPKDATAYLNLGFLLRSQGSVTEGNNDLKTAVLLDPSLASRIPPGTLATPKPAASSPRP